MDAAIRLVSLFAFAFVGSVVGEYIVMRRHESDETSYPQSGDSLAEEYPTVNAVIPTVEG